MNSFVLSMVIVPGVVALLLVPQTLARAEVFIGVALPTPWCHHHPHPVCVAPRPVVAPPPVVCAARPYTCVQPVPTTIFLALRSAVDRVLVASKAPAFAT